MKDILPMHLDTTVHNRPSTLSLIDQAESVDDIRRRESFWQYELDTFQPNGLNERDVALF